MQSKVRISSDEVYILENVIQEELQKANILAGLGRIPDATKAFDKASQIYLEVFGSEDDLPSAFIKTASELISAGANLTSYPNPSLEAAIKPQTDKALPEEIRRLWDFIWKIVTIGG